MYILLTAFTINVSRDNWQSSYVSAPFWHFLRSLLRLPINFVFCVWWLVYTWDVLNPKIVRFPFAPLQQNRSYFDCRENGKAKTFCTVFSPSSRMWFIVCTKRKHKTLTYTTPQCRNFPFLSSFAAFSRQTYKKYHHSPNEEEIQTSTTVFHLFHLRDIFFLIPGGRASFSGLGS